MSRKVQAKHSIVVANAKTGGAFITKVQRKRICKSMVEWCFSRQYLINSMTDVTVDMVREYMTELKAKGISTATLHNRLASIRVAMTALGSDPDALGITANSVGLAPRSRTGTKVPIPNELLEIAIAKAIEEGEPGFALCLRLQRLLGLRGLESVMSISALEKFALEASEFAKSEIHITKGTKGGRPRMTTVIQARAAETLQTIHAALIHMKDHGYLIQGTKLGLKTARSHYHLVAKNVGLVGKYAPHSLRYAFAVEKLVELRDLGFNRKEAGSFVAQWLGHGSSRDRYVSMVYGKTVIHTLPVEKRKPSLDKALGNIERLIEAQNISFKDHQQGLF
ncbi:MAG: hypothetical protein RJB10_888 [Pseudomonadota bacterium]|jgi:site-specific recombinase XerD